MIFRDTGIPGCFVIQPEKNVDRRGFFARVFDSAVFSKLGLDARVAQCSVSFNAAEGTLRGLHYQLPPHEESKTVLCTRGRIFDVAVDVRPSSETYLHWHGSELSAENSLGMFIPRGIAHGFVTLEPESEVFYLISSVYEPSSAAGIRWNDPALGIAWPRNPSCISERDEGWPLLPSRDELLK